MTHHNLRIPVNGMQWEVVDSDGNVLPSDVFEVLESTERVRRDRGSATHEIYFSIDTRPMDLLTVNIKKTVVMAFDASSDIKDDNSITNGAITLTFGRMGVETLNGQPFTNELLWFNSSQGGAKAFF